MRTRAIYLSRGRSIEVSERMYHQLVIYKLMFPPGHQLHISPEKTIRVSDYNIYAPPEQHKLLEVKPVEIENIKNMG